MAKLTQDVTVHLGGAEIGIWPIEIPVSMSVDPDPDGAHPAVNLALDQAGLFRNLAGACRKAAAEYDALAAKQEAEAAT